MGSGGGILAYAAAFVPLGVALLNLLGDKPSSGAEIVGRSVAILALHAAGALAAGWICWRVRPLGPSGLRMPALFGLIWNGLALAILTGVFVTSFLNAVEKQASASAPLAADPEWQLEPRSIFDRRAAIEFGCEPLELPEVDALDGRSRVRRAACRQAGLELNAIFVDTSLSGTYDLNAGARSVSDLVVQGLTKQGAQQIRHLRAGSLSPPKATTVNLGLSYVNRSGRSYEIAGRGSSSGSDAVYVLLIFAADDHTARLRAGKALSSFHILGGFE